MYGVCVYPYTIINTHFVVLSMYLTKLMHGIQRGLYITKIGQEKTVGHAVTQSHLLTAYLASQLKCNIEGVSTTYGVMY